MPQACEFGVRTCLCERQDANNNQNINKSNTIKSKSLQSIQKLLKETTTQMKTRSCNVTRIALTLGSASLVLGATSLLAADGGSSAMVVPRRLYAPDYTWVPRSA